jgi:hypothetical protein
MNQKKEKFLNKIFAFIGLLSLLVFAGYQILPSLLSQQTNSSNQNTNLLNQGIENLPAEQNINLETNQSIVNLSLGNTETTPTPQTTPTKALFDVPFTSQAPYAVWDALHNEACEEASLVMANAYLKNEKLDAATAEKQIQDMVAWQIKTWGEHKDLTLDEENQLAQATFGYQNFRVEKNIRVEDVRTELNNGHILILPMAGRLLGNPNFRNPGPIYHMLVVIGYDGNNFITNDPGTKNGRHYVYSADVLFNALHDWPGKDKDVTTGAKDMLVIEP